MTDVAKTIERFDRHTHALDVVEKASDEYDNEELAEICAAVEESVREESQKRDVGKHGGIACLYMVVDRLAEADGGDERAR